MSSFFKAVGLSGILLCVASVAPSQVLAAAQPSPSVEVYADEALGETGILPQGMQWNHPLKAGDMVLPRTTSRRPAPKLAEPEPLRMPVGAVKAPQIQESKTQPPSVSSETSSTAGVMLLQGMKNALQQAGQNPDIPKSDLEPQTSTEKTAPSSEPLSLMPPLLPSAKAEPAKQTALPDAFSIDAIIKDKSSEQTPETAAKRGFSYEPGQEPKTLAILESPSGEKTPAAGKDQFEIVFPPEMGAETSSAPPASLEEAERAFTEQPSIFGAPVADEPAARDGTCVPQVKKWTRSCADAGYPEHFTGGIEIETRNECPSGESKDVWLSNSCAEPTGQAAAQGQILSLPPAAPETGAAIDASCGVSNGLATPVAPMVDLCLAGRPTPVDGQGPWRWTCLGANGGMTVSCAAPVAVVRGEGRPAASAEKAGLPIIEDGKCGAANGQSALVAPTENLCDKGTPSRVSGGGPWTWACSGLNGGAPIACAAPRKIDGVCGSAGRDGVETMPVRDLCEAGYASAVTGSGPWNWTCSGLHGGAAATCEALPRLNAVCGEASMVGHREKPEDRLCSVGRPTQIAGQGPWNWTCQGGSGGADVSCEAPVLTDGQCGSAHGSQFLDSPSEGLCEKGTSSRVTGLGPWNWTCVGEHGGASESCTALMGTRDSVQGVVRCGVASEMLALTKPEANLCAAGQPSAVSGEGPWSWTCSDEAGHSAVCTTLTAVQGSCGKAANVATSYAPLTDLCDAGAPTDVVSDEKALAWKWSCRGAMGGAHVECTAPMTQRAKEKVEERLETGKCGPAAGRGFVKMPEKDLCAVGTPSPVRGVGPWSWTCGGKKGPKAICDAPRLADGACGAANGSIQRDAPASALCASGVATEVTGDGPWLWSCVGTGGGMSVSCSAASAAQTRVDGTCGAAANTLMAAAPDINLCDTGTASAVHGDGPWTWTCSGANGGIASTCSTNKVVPKAPPPPGPRENGVCGPANGVAATDAPKDGLCSGGLPTAISGDGPWNWSCLGVNSGMTVSCTAPMTPPTPIVGMCGAASGAPTLTIPQSSLCVAGIASAVSGKGPWTWSCSGTNGGGAVSCVAPVAGGSTHGLPSLVTPSVEAPAPKAAPSGLVTPQLPAGQLPPLKAGAVPSRKIVKPLKLAPEEESIPAESIDMRGAKAPVYAPELPDDSSPLVPPGEDEKKVLRGMRAPVLDSEGKPLPNARLNLKQEVSLISFSHGSDRLDRSAVNGLERLAAILRDYEDARITLVAYSSVDGKITPRAARRLSLSRALAIRDFLESKGVRSERIDVRPMGGNVPSGDMDRVDVRVN